MLKFTAVLLPLVFCLASAALEPAKVADRWNVALEIGSITGHPTLELKQDGDKLTGTYRGRYGASALEGTVQDNKIEFSVTINAEGQPTAGYFAGKVDGDNKMSGVVEFEGAGEGTWTAARVIEK